MGIFGFFNKHKKETLDKGLKKTKEGFFDKLKKAVIGHSKVDEDVLDNLEDILISSDVGVDTTLRIIERIEKRVEKDKYVNTAELNQILREEIEALLVESKNTEEDFSLSKEKHPYVIMVVGVNGV
ncbi:MAG TPA: signal recognition particle-docking protein FtsY, partial [Porphyromonadaceae bacterium]|nr:signal recognition particle-docking protein FtsY [Porphyromonadaceae bacterium]